MALAIDVNVSTDANAKTGATVTATTPSFTTATATELLVLFIEATLNSTTPNPPSMSSVSGAGLTWTQVSVKNVASSGALAAVYIAFATSVLTAQTVSASLTNPHGASDSLDVSITLLSFTGADQVNGVGATPTTISSTSG